MTFPVSGSNDPFNRGPESPLSFGGRWVEYVNPGGYHLKNVAVLNTVEIDGSSGSGTATAGALWVADGEIEDSDAWVGVEDIAPGQIVLLARAQTPGGAFVTRDGYECDYTSSGVTIYSTVAGARTALGSFTHIFQSGDAVGFSVRGSTLEAWVFYGMATGGTGGWQLVLTVTDTTFTSGYPGFYLNLVQPSIASWAGSVVKIMNVWLSGFHGRGDGPA